MAWLLDLVVSWVGGNLGGILTGLGALGAVVVAFFAGKKDERQKGQIATQKETIDAYQDRQTVEDRLRNADPNADGSVRSKYRRD